MPLEIKDDTPAELVAQLSQLQGLTRQDAIRLTAQAGLDSAQEAIPLRAHVQALRPLIPSPRRQVKPPTKTCLMTYPGQDDDLCRGVFLIASSPISDVRLCAHR
jgi:hypothetical protein